MSLETVETLEGGWVDHVHLSHHRGCPTGHHSWEVPEIEQIVGGPGASAQYRLPAVEEVVIGLPLAKRAIDEHRHFDSGQCSNQPGPVESVVTVGGDQDIGIALRRNPSESPFLYIDMCTPSTNSAGIDEKMAATIGPGVALVAVELLEFIMTE